MQHLDSRCRGEDVAHKYRTRIQYTETDKASFSLKEPVGGWILGAGPVFLLPTATDELLGSEKWGVGPTVLALQQTPDGWTYGALVNHIWSFAGDDDRNEISNTFIQPFLAKQFAGGRTITLNSESSYEWFGKGWNAPVNLMYSKVTKWGSQMVSYRAASATLSRRRATDRSGVCASR